MRRLVLAAACAATAVITTAPANAAEVLDLETRGTPGATVAGPVATTAPLTDGATYFVRVSGTSSIYTFKDWLVPGKQACGLPEAGPLFPTPGVVNGVTGMDAETVFAVPVYAPFHGFTCAPATFPFRITRYTDGGLQLATDAAFAHREPVGGARDVPRADHTYTYKVIGTGVPLRARWVDTPLQDNYGRYRVEVLTAEECAAQSCEQAAQPANDQVLGTGAVTKPLAQSVAQTTTTVKACVSRRLFRVRVRAYPGIAIRSATLTARGKTYVMVRSGRRIRGYVDMRGLPYGRFTVTITAVTTRGQRLTDVRTYRTCRVKSRSRGVATTIR